MSALCVALIEWCLVSICSSVSCGFTPASKSIWGNASLEQRWIRASRHLLTEAGQRLDPTTVVWRGDHTLPVDEQGVKVLGTPLGHRDSGSISPQSRVKGGAPRDATREFEDARRCLGRLLGLVLPDAAWDLTALLLNLGGLERHSRKTCLQHSSPVGRTGWQWSRRDTGLYTSF